MTSGSSPAAAAEVSSWLNWSSSTPTSSTWTPVASVNLAMIAWVFATRSGRVSRSRPGSCCRLAAPPSSSATTTGREAEQNKNRCERDRTPGRGKHPCSFAQADAAGHAGSHACLASAPASRDAHRGGVAVAPDYLCSSKPHLRLMTRRNASRIGMFPTTGPALPFRWSAVDRRGTCRRVRTAPARCCSSSAAAASEPGTTSRTSLVGPLHRDDQDRRPAGRAVSRRGRQHRRRPRPAGDAVAGQRPGDDGARRPTSARPTAGWR